MPSRRGPGALATIQVRPPSSHQAGLAIRESRTSAGDWDSALRVVQGMKRGKTSAVSKPRLSHASTRVRSVNGK
jgi:hypothetical protein